MSNNRNRNRGNAPVQQRQRVQDKPFIYRGKNGDIVIPHGTVFDPDADVFDAITEAEEAGNDIARVSAMHRLIVNGFPPEIGRKIKLKASELEDFTQKFFSWNGTPLPK